MDTDEFRAKMHDIIDGLEDTQSAAFEYSLSTGSQHVQEALSRAVLLIGATSIELVDGFVKDDEDSGEVEGWLVVTTADRLVRATFARSDVGQSNVVVEAVSLSSVRSVRVESLRAGHQDDDAWPAKAKITLMIDREVAGTNEVVIPSTGLAEKHLAGAIAALAQRLPTA